MKLLRTLSTRSLLLLAVVVAALSGGGAAIAVAASHSSGPTPAPKPLDQALQDALAAPAPDGITARIKFTNKLFPSGDLLGNVSSALMSGATGRLWATNDGRGRLELQSNAGDAQIVWNTKTVTLYDASSNTAYRATLPAHKADATPDTTPDTKTPPSLAKITSFLTDLGAQATISGATPTNVAGQEAYSVKLSPKHDGGLLGSLRLAWDAAQGIPLRVAIYAQGSSSPVLELTATEITYGAVPASEVEVTPPAGAKIVEVNAPSKPDASSKPDGADGSKSSVTGLAAVQAAAGFPVVAPDTLVGLPRKDVRLVGGSAALAVYGQGLGAIVVVERKADPNSAGNTPPKEGSTGLSSLPTISLDGVTGHELATQLGTVLEWQRGGVDYVLAGSLPTAAAEAAARDLK